MEVVKRFYLTLMLYELWKQFSMWDVSERFQQPRGFVQNLLSSAASFACCVQKFCQVYYIEIFLVFIVLNIVTLMSLFNIDSNICTRVILGNHSGLYFDNQKCRIYISKFCSVVSWTKCLIDNIIVLLMYWKCKVHVPSLDDNG